MPIGENMFEDALAINWTDVGHHVYGGNHRIPSALENLLSSDAHERQAAREFLFGSGQSCGEIFDTTPLLIRFACRVLLMPEAPEKVELLGYVWNVAVNILCPRPSIWEMQCCVATSKAFQENLGVFLELLADQDSMVQGASIDILAELPNDAHVSLPALMAAFWETSDRVVRQRIVQACKSLIPHLDWRQHALSQMITTFMREIFDRLDDPMLMIAASRVAVELPGRYDQVPKSLVQKVLSDEFFVLSSPFRGESFDQEFYQQQLLQDLTALGRDALAGLLQHPSLTPLTALLITRALLYHMFGRHRETEDFWGVWPTMDSTPQRVFYPSPYGLYGPCLPLTVTAYDRELLQMIGATDAVWVIPTNLFSRFFGLPDSREAFQALLE